MGLGAVKRFLIVDKDVINAAKSLMKSSLIGGLHPVPLICERKSSKCSGGSPWSAETWSDPGAVATFMVWMTGVQVESVVVFLQWD
ncbi:unnamed protein product [Strongylus vulgaris]|uniref:Uncharacterized protein n=1 Tax=Strongylus vulgaris TaxID=40348 RepID=A0A3P7KHB4_STRVU|nr:unnamed protein product [Strongylus vulgaris]